MNYSRYPQFLQNIYIHIHVLAWASGLERDTLAFPMLGVTCD